MNPFQRGHISTGVASLDADEVWLNDMYQVNVRELPNGITHLSIKRLDKLAIHDWRDLQMIKNALTDYEREGIELYPAESRLVDSSNSYHLWVLPKGTSFPVGWMQRLVVKGHDGGYKKGSGQRDFNEGEEPFDAISKERADEMMNALLKKGVSNGRS